MLTLLVVILVLVVLLYGWGGRDDRYWSYGPSSIVGLIVVLFLLWLLFHLVGAV